MQVQQQDEAVLKARGISSAHFAQLIQGRALTSLPLQSRRLKVKRGCGCLATATISSSDVFAVPYAWRGSRYDADARDADWELVVPNSASLVSFARESDVLIACAHADNHNLVVVALEAMLVVWSLARIEVGEAVTRDWAPNMKRGSRKRSAFLCHMLGDSDGFHYREEAEWNKQFLRQMLSEPLAVLGALKTATFSSGASMESTATAGLPLATKTDCWAVFSDDPTLLKWLQRETVSWLKCVEDKHEAGLVYTTRNVKFGGGGGDGDLDFQTGRVAGLNQFPRESCLVCKDLLLQLVRGAGNPSWAIVPAFDCDTELHHFVAAFEARRAQSGDASNNAWIIKPARASRGLGHVISDNVSLCVAAASRSSDYVAQVYLTPKQLLLFDGRKFDLRTIVIVASFEPLAAWSNTNATFARVALRRAHEGDYCRLEGNFTVSKYWNQRPEAEAPAVLSRQALMDHFSSERWLEIENACHAMLRGVFTSASRVIRNEVPQCCRGAVYGVDWIIDAELNTRLIEVNFCPDLATSAQMDPSLPLSIMTVLAGGAPDSPFSVDQSGGDSVHVGAQWRRL